MSMGCCDAPSVCMASYIFLFAEALSRSSFEAYLVNDSNYYIFLSVSAKATDSSDWTYA